MSEAPSTPVVVKLEVETDWGCELRDDGSLWCWGNDPSVALGLRAPTRVWTQASLVEGSPKFVDIASADNQICGVAEAVAGSVFCWGRGIQEPTRIFGVQQTVEIEAGGHTCARDTDGVVRCWSVPASGSDPSVSELTRDAIDLAVGPRLGCTLDVDGGVWCWPIASHGPPPRFESAGLDRRGAAVKVAQLAGAVELDIGDNELCVRLDQGELWCSTSSLERPPYTFEHVDDGIVTLAHAEDHACVIRSDASVRCFGANNWAQLGDENASISGATVIGTSASYSCVAGRAGVRCWGTRSTGHDDERPRERHVLPLDATSLVIDREFGCVTTSAGELSCWGTRDPFSGQSILAATPRVIADHVDPLAKLQGPCALEFDGDLRCDLLDPDGVNGRSPASLAGVSDFATHPYFDYLCVIVDAGLQCFDTKSWTPLSTPTGIRKPTAIGFEDDPLCVIHDGGALACLFVGDTELSIVSSSNNYVALAQGAAAKCALDEGGQVACWSYFLLDDGGLAHSRPNVLSQLPAGVEAVATDDGVCVRTADGRVACGKRYGEDPSVEWLDVVDAVSLAAGSRHVCAGDGEGQITCVGDNGLGQLGAKPSTLMLTPIRIEDGSMSQ